MTELPLHNGLLALAVAILLFSGVVKSVTGLGIPVVGTPLLTVVYGHLPIIVSIMSIPTTIASGYFVLRTFGKAREAVGVLVPLMPFGILGVVGGTHILVRVPEQIVAGVLAAVIAVFVITQVAARRAPTRDLQARPVTGPIAGFLAGALQGTSGASGPMLTMYLLRRPLSRHGFILAANVAFFAFDVTQMITLASLGQFTSPRLVAAGVAIVPLFAGIAVGWPLAQRIDDRAFRHGVLVLLALTAISLGAKAAA